MNCPACKDVVLTMADRQGVEIDYCPKCRGVWLDRGELDKIIERSEPSGRADQTGGAGPSAAPPPQAQPPQPQYQQPPPAYQRPLKMDDSDHYGYQYRGPGHHPGYKKRKSILREIFDF